ncbi:MAG: phenylalanine--tRNA ligase subunit alpha [Acidobacteriota bacterium]
MQLSEIDSHFEADLQAVDSAEALEALRIRYLGRGGALAAARDQVDFRSLAPEERKEVGQTFNRVKTRIEEAIAGLKETLGAGAATKDLPAFDVTLPPVARPPGTIHPLIATQIQVEDIFHSMGFRVFQGDEAVSEYDNFDAVNIPGDHPAREMQDTFWLENGDVLRTHTSSMQNRAMRELGVPLRAIFPGRCYRAEATDATHENTFFQLEGMYIDREVSVANLIAVMKHLLMAVFQSEIDVRLRPGYFPFVEPGFELDFRSSVVGDNLRWIELMPCGMIHPAVLREGGVDPEEYSGFAFGLGLSRLAMLKFGIPDVRLFNKGDLRFNEQFVATF